MESSKNKAVKPPLPFLQEIKGLRTEEQREHFFNRIKAFGVREANLGANETDMPRSPRKIDSKIKADEVLDDTTLNNVMHALMLGYVVTSGTYSKQPFIEKTTRQDNRIALMKSLPVGAIGWQRRLHLDRNPAEGENGVHGIVLTNDFKQAIIVIRGTDLPRQASNCTEDSGCRSDLCADKDLWDFPWDVISSSDIPSWCKRASAEHDYIGEATEFVTKALSNLEDYHQILLVGHSLGAGLAILVGADILNREEGLGRGTTMHVVAVSPPPYSSHLSKTKLDERFTLIYNDLDPTLWATRYRGGFHGTDPQCYSTRSIRIRDDTIRECVEECIPAVEEKMKPDVFGTVWADGKCDGCYPETHELGPYLKASRNHRKLRTCTFQLPQISTDFDELDMNEKFQKMDEAM
jgi:hypothetical protein